MSNVKNVFIAPGDGDYQVERMFITSGWGITETIEDADLLQFVGGADVDPSLYGQYQHSTTIIDEARDAREMEMYLYGIELGIPMAGICRGGQFLNVMNGGTMFQHVDGHGLAKTHKAWLIGAVLPIDVTSTHHQMMHPNWSAHHEIVMTAAEAKRKFSMSRTDYGKYESIAYPPADKNTDIECIFYRDTRCLCFQPHPEYTGTHTIETREVYFTLLDRYLFASEQDEKLRDEA